MKLTAHDIPESVWKQRSIVSRSLYYLRRSRGWSPQQAAMTPRNGNKATKGPGLATMCRDAGLHWQAGSDFKRRHPEQAADMTDEEIVAHLVAHHARESIAEQARERGLDPRTVHARIHKLGWSLERALSTPAQRPGSTIMQNRRRA